MKKISLAGALTPARSRRFRKSQAKVKARKLESTAGNDFSLINLKSLEIIGRFGTIKFLLFFRSITNHLICLVVGAMLL